MDTATRGDPISFALRVALALGGIGTLTVLLLHSVIVVALPVWGTTGDRDDFLQSSGVVTLGAVLLVAAGLGARRCGAAPRVGWWYGSGAGLLLLLGILWALQVPELEGQGLPASAWLDGAGLAFRLPFTGLLAAAIALVPVTGMLRLAHSRHAS